MAKCTSRKVLSGTEKATNIGALILALSSVSPWGDALNIGGYAIHLVDLIIHKDIRPKDGFEWLIEIV